MTEEIIAKFKALLFGSRFGQQICEVFLTVKTISKSMSPVENRLGEEETQPHQFLLLLTSPLKFHLLITLTPFLTSTTRRYKYQMIF